MPTSAAIDIATPETGELMWTPAELIEKFFRGKFTEKTLANWRAAGFGPPYVKAGTAVFYRPSSADAWARSQEWNTIKGAA